MWWNIVLGVLFILGGLSGGVVLRGTDSSELLVAVGVGLLGFGLYQRSHRSDAVCRLCGARIKRQDAERHFLSRHPAALGLSPPSPVVPDQVAPAVGPVPSPASKRRRRTLIALVVAGSAMVLIAVSSLAGDGDAGGPQAEAPATKGATLPNHQLPEYPIPDNPLPDWSDSHFGPGDCAAVSGQQLKQVSCEAAAAELKVSKTIALLTPKFSELKGAERQAALDRLGQRLCPSAQGWSDELLFLACWVKL